MLRVFFLHLRSAAKNRSAMFLPIPNREDLIPELTRIAEGAMEDHFADDVLDRAEGSQHYRVNLTSEAGGLRLECSCPYEENCKHLAAFVWLVTEEWGSAPEQAVGPEENARAFTDYLETLSQAELIQLLDLFAPPEFRREIALREATADTVDAAFSAVVRRVEKLLTGGPAGHAPRTERIRHLSRARAPVAGSCSPRGGLAGYCPGAHYSRMRTEPGGLGAQAVGGAAASPAHRGAAAACWSAGRVGRRP